jgi:hypothetical protein
VSNVLPLTIESLVAILLLLTILYCVRLNNQLKLLKADGSTMQTTIAELVTATENAERAISGLKTTVREADQSLGESLKLAERYSADLHQNIAAGAEVLHRLTQIADARPSLSRGQAATPASNPVKPAAPDPKAIVAAAQAFTERALARSKALAA